jgi:hypothetical protein
MELGSEETLCNTLRIILGKRINHFGVLQLLITNTPIYPVTDK